MAKEKSTAMKAAILFDKIQKLRLDCEIKCDALEYAAEPETRIAYRAQAEAHARGYADNNATIDYAEMTEDPDA
jgi:hypothetical protein